MDAPTPWTSVTAPPRTSCASPITATSVVTPQRTDEPGALPSRANDCPAEVPEQDRLDDQRPELAEAEAQVLRREQREQRGRQEQRDGQSNTR